MRCAARTTRASSPTRAPRAGSSAADGHERREPPQRAAPDERRPAHAARVRQARRRRRLPEHDRPRRRLGGDADRVDRRQHEHRAAPPGGDGLRGRQGDPRRRDHPHAGVGLQRQGPVPGLLVLGAHRGDQKRPAHNPPQGGGDDLRRHPDRGGDDDRRGHPLPLRAADTRVAGADRLRLRRGPLPPGHAPVTGPPGLGNPRPMK